MLSGDAVTDTAILVTACEVACKGMSPMEEVHDDILDNTTQKYTKSILNGIVCWIHDYCVPLHLYS